MGKTPAAGRRRFSLLSSLTDSGYADKTAVKFHSEAVRVKKNHLSDPAPDQSGPESEVP